MLRGERVTLRPFERADIPRLHELRANTELVMLANDQWDPRSLAALERQFEQMLAASEPAWFVIEVDGRVIGGANLHGQSRFEGVAEIGIFIYDPEYVGRGYGREAIALLLDWAFRVQNWRRIWLEALADNERAVRVYRACGFVQEGMLRQHAYSNGRYHDVILMGLMREEWEAARG